MRFVVSLAYSVGMAAVAAWPVRADTPHPPQVISELSPQIEPSVYPQGYLGQPVGVRLSDGREAVIYDDPSEIPQPVPAGAHRVELDDGRTAVAMDIVTPLLPYTLAGFIAPAGPTQMTTGEVSGDDAIATIPYRYKDMFRLKTGVTIDTADGKHYTLVAGSRGFYAGRYSYGPQERTARMVCVLTSGSVDGQATLCALKPEDTTQSQWIFTGPNTLTPLYYRYYFTSGYGRALTEITTFIAPLDIEDEPARTTETATLELRAPYWRDHTGYTQWWTGQRLVWSDITFGDTVSYATESGLLTLTAIEGFDLRSRVSFAAGPIAEPSATASVDTGPDPRRAARQGPLISEGPLVLAPKGKIRRVLLNDGRRGFAFSDPSAIADPLPFVYDKVPLSGGEVAVVRYPLPPLLPDSLAVVVDGDAAVEVTTGSVDSRTAILRMPVHYNKMFRLKTAATIKGHALPAGTLGFYGGDYTDDRGKASRLLCVFDPAVADLTRTLCALKAEDAKASARWYFTGPDTAAPDFIPVLSSRDDVNRIAPLNIEDGSFALPHDLFLEMRVAWWGGNYSGIMWTISERVVRVESDDLDRQDHHGRLTLERVPGDDRRTQVTFLPDAAAGPPAEVPIAE